jgi:acyl dehydratase
MALNYDADGTVSQPATASWSSKDALLYAVSLGCGTNELSYTTENTSGLEQQVLPTFPVVIAAGGDAFGAIGEYNKAMMVHGAQAVTLHRPLPASGSATVVSRVAGLYDKGKAAVAVFESNATDIDGQPLYTTTTSIFIRGEGGWGGDRGPSGAQNVPPDRAPDHAVTYQTSPDQALLYRLNGDRNPLHSDPSFAAMGGFPQPILHGLCTYGFTGRALLHALCEGESAAFKHIEARFASPVLPGEALTVAMWVTAPGEAVFTTSVADRVVLDQGLVRYTA